jgi:hypothetical protein
MKKKSEQILQEILESQEKGTAIGIQISERKTLIISNVVKILSCPDGDSIVIVKAQTIYGEYLSKNEFLLSEIVSAKNLKIKYDDPLYGYLRGLRGNIARMRNQKHIPVSVY